MLIRRLLDRHVPQWVGFYVAGGWGFVQFVDWAVDEYALAPALTTFVGVLLLLFLPTVVFLAWRHGATGASRWTRADGGFVAANLAVATLVVFALDLRLDGPATEIRMVENAQGDTVTRVVPAASDMKVVLLFDFDNRTGDPSNDWLEYGLRFAVNFDLQQDIFVGAIAPEDGLVREMRSEAGIGPYDPIPLPLMRRFADRKDTDFFFDGTIERGEGGSGSEVLIARTRLFATSSGNEIASHSYEFSDPLEAADRISRDLRADLGFESDHLNEIPDLAVRELTSTSLEAYRHIAEARVKEWREGDTEGALRHVERAIELDSTAALAHLARSSILRRSGDQAGYAASASALSRYDYRLPERMRLQGQVWRQLELNHDIDAAIRAASYWVEISPSDPMAHHTLAEAYEAAGDLEEELRARRAVLSLEPDALWAREELADSFADAGLADSALVYYERLRNDHPDQLDLRHTIAQILVDAGRFDEAREELADAVAAAPGDPGFRREQAILELRAGNPAEAQALMREAPTRNLTAYQRERWAGFREMLSHVRGRFVDLETAYRERLRLLPQYVPPISIPGRIDNSEYLLYANEAGRTAEALDEIARLQSTVDAPHNLELEWPAALLHVATGDVEAARVSLEKLEQLAAAGGDYLGRRAQRAWLEGRIAEMESSDCRRALPSYEEAVRVSPGYIWMRLTLMECHASLRNWDDAQEHADRLLRIRPGFPVVRLAVARYLVARGDEDGAREHLDAALLLWTDADPDYIPAQDARALRARLSASGS